METSVIIDIANVIKERTESNDHTTSLIIASTLLDNITGAESNTTKILTHIREIHYLTGHMPVPLLELRESYRQAIMAGLKESLTITYYEKIESAF